MSAAKPKKARAPRPHRVPKARMSPGPRIRNLNPDRP